MKPVHTVSLTQFVDFMLATGGARITTVMHHLTSDGAERNYYAPWLEAAIWMLREGAQLGLLRFWTDAFPDEKRRPKYAELTAGLLQVQKWKPGDHTTVWDHPAPALLTIAPGYAVNVNPELGFETGYGVIGSIEDPYVTLSDRIKLYCRSDKLEVARADVILAVMDLAMGSGKSKIDDYCLGVLDVRRSRLFSADNRKDQIARLRPLILAEGAAYAALHTALKEELRRVPPANQPGPVPPPTESQEGLSNPVLPNGGDTTNPNGHVAAVA